VLTLVLGYLGLTLVFSRFPVTQSWSWELRQFALERTWELVRALVGALPGLLTVVAILWVFRVVIRAVEHFFDRVERGQVVVEGFHPELAPPSRRLASMLLWIAAVLVAYPYIPGAESKSVQGISVLLGLMVSLGSSGVVGNFIAGLVLTYSRSFSLGDRVRIGEHVGDVIALGTFATKLRSLRNEEITLPNGSILSGTILNYTRRTAEGGLWLHTQVTIGYDVEWRRVHGLLIEAALAVPGVEREPAPIVYQRALNDFHVSYEITCLTHDSHAQLRLYSDLHAAIQDAFARAGVEILSPAFANLRDANAPVLPSEPQGPRDEPGGFRFRGPRPGA
jgi:small-conductance mechanosensitive channel